MACKILMLTSVPLAAPWNGADKNVARALIQRDSEDTFIIQTEPDEPWPKQRVRAIRMRSSGDLPTGRQKLRMLAFLIRYTRSADVVHVIASFHSPPALLGPLLAAWSRSARRPFIHTVPSIGDGPVRRRDFFGDTTVVFSEHTRHRLACIGVPNVVRIDPPIDLEALVPVVPSADLRSTLRLGPLPILYPGHFGNGSGIQEVIKAFAALPPEFGEAVLVLACRAHAWQDRAAEERDAKHAAEAAGVGHRIRIVSPVPDMPALISACVMTVLVPWKTASKMDLPMVILESLFLKRPVIVSDIAPMRESLLGDGGLAVRPGDIPALSQAMATLLAQPDLRVHLGQRGRSSVMERCDAAKVALRYRDIYQRSLRG